MRRIFGKVMNEIIKKIEKLSYSVGDIGYGILDDVRKIIQKLQNQGYASKVLLVAWYGFILNRVYTITPFLIERPFEQIILILINKKQTKLVGFADYPMDQAMQINKEMMKLFKNIKSYFPKNSIETKKMIYKSYYYNGPSFISLKADNLLRNEACD